MAAKTVRQQDKANGIKKGRGFYRPANVKWDWKLNRYIRETT
jgi:hypothetical protein